MKLVALGAHFVRYETALSEITVIVGDHETWRERGCPTTREIRPITSLFDVADFTEAQGVMFLCPLCCTRNGGDVGTHWIDVTFEGRGATDEQGTHDHDGRPTRWAATGTAIHDLTLRPSIDLSRGEGCAWHGFVTDGTAT